MFYLKFMCICTTFIKKLKNFIKKQRRYEFLKIIVFWLNGLKILRHEGPTVHCTRWETSSGRGRIGHSHQFIAFCPVIGHLKFKFAFV